MDEESTLMQERGTERFNGDEESSFLIRGMIDQETVS